MKIALIQGSSQREKNPLVDIVPDIDREFLRSVLQRKCVWDYLCEHGTNDELKMIFKQYVS